MPTLNDIPEPIRSDPSPDIFMAWIRPIPVPTQVKQALATHWMRKHNTRLHPAHWQELLNYQLPRTKQNAPPISTSPKR